MLKKRDTRTTRLSTKGQVILPKDLRDRRGWKPGAEFVVEERPEGVLLKLRAEDGPARMADVFGVLSPAPRTASLDDMRQAVLDEARRRWERDRDDRD